jgi:hypothetical protein
MSDSDEPTRAAAAPAPKRARRRKIITSTDVDNADAEGEEENKGDKLLTYSNLVHVATEYARAHGLKTDDLGEVLLELTTHTRWIAAHALVKNGVSQYYFDLFRSRMTSSPAPVWWNKRPTRETDSTPPRSAKKPKKAAAAAAAASEEEEEDADDESS